MSIRELKQKREAKRAEMRQLYADAEAAGEMGEERQKRFDALKAEERDLTRQIDARKHLDELERGAELANGRAADLDREARQISLKRAAQITLGEERGGREQEVSDELARSLGMSPRGILVPTERILGERRALNSYDSGGWLIDTATRDDMLIRELRPLLAVEQLGAMVLQGLVGNVVIPRISASATAEWVGEDSAPTASNPTFDQISMKPRTVAAQTELTRRMIVQTDNVVDPIIREHLGFQLAAALDRAAIRGNGVGEPLGILNIDAITPVSAATHFSDTNAALIAELETANVRPPYGFLTNGTVAKTARQELDGDNRVIPMAELFHNVPVAISEQVPATLGAGGDESAIIIGRWSDLVIGYWSAIDILADPYSNGSKGNVRLYAFLDADVNHRHRESFAYSQSNSF